MSKKNEALKSLILLKYGSITGFARMAKISTSSVSNIIAGKRPSDHMALLLSILLDCEESLVQGEREEVEPVVITPEPSLESSLWYDADKSEQGYKNIYNVLCNIDRNLGKIVDAL